MSTSSDLSSLADELRSDQRQRWLQGDRVLIEAYLADHPELSRDPELLLNLAVSEFCLREELGDKPDPSEYLRRFPDHSDRLLKLLETRRAKRAQDTNATATNAALRRRLTCPYCLRGMPAPSLEEAHDVICPHCGKSVLVVEETLSRHEAVVGVMGRFDLLEHLGHGNFGDVWRARDTQLGRDVAIKVPRRMPDSPVTRQMFLREAKAAAQLQHPNIVPVFEVGKEGERLYIVCGLVRGTTLKAWLEEHRFAHDAAARLTLTLARALEHAHRGGIVHRDLKPGNILLDHDNEPHIADFGLAKQSSDETTLAQQGDVVGTPAYMSPEQARGDVKRVDHRSDIYSLGVVLYELLTGQRPFESKGQVLVHELLNCEPPPPRKLQADVPADLETICLKALAKDPGNRYDAAADMADDLQRYLDGEPIDARPPSRLRKAWRWTRRNRTLAASLVVFFGSAALMGGSMIPDPPASPATADTCQVVVETEPTGAKIVVVPLDDVSREPQPERMFHCTELSPVKVQLPPGDYLIVAVKDNHGFHEVYRHVPKPEDVYQFKFYHREWTRDAQGTIHWRRIAIPSDRVTVGMAKITGAQEFLMGEPESKAHPQHRRRVPDFYIETREVTLGDYKTTSPGFLPSRMQKDPPPDEFPVIMSVDEAMNFAERIGKRLLTETEFEYAATAGGTQRFPWGNAIPADLDETTRSPIPGAVAFDRLNTLPPVFGLASGTAEWTISCPIHYPGNGQLPFTVAVRDWRVVRGGGPEVLKGNLSISEEERNPRGRLSLLHDDSRPGLGFRCARSAKPRLRVEDFERTFTTSTAVPASQIGNTRVLPFERP